MLNYDTVYHLNSISDKAFLITGGAGFIGSHIAEYLLKHNAKKVRVVDNLSNGKIENTEIFQSFPNYEFINGDITDPEFCIHQCKGIDAVCHQAALGSVPRSIEFPLATNASNVSGFLNMINACREMGVERFVYASSSSVYGDNKTLPKVEENIGHSLSPYAVSKRSNELYAKVYSELFGMKILGLRYFNIFGPRQDPDGAYAAVIPLFVKQVLEGKAPSIDGDGGQTRDFTFVANAVQANIKALTIESAEAFGGVYNIAVGQNFSVNQLYQRICQNLGIELEPHYRPARPGDVRDSLASIQKAQKAFDYQPEFAFGNGLDLTINYFKSIFEKA